MITSQKTDEEEHVTIKSLFLKARDQNLKQKSIDLTCVNQIHTNGNLFLMPK